MDLRIFSWGLAAALLPLMSGAVVLAKEEPAPKQLIEPKALAEQLDAKGLRVLDTRSAEEYAQGHIPGAVPIDVKDWQALVKTEDGFTNRGAWAKRVGGLGITPETRVVVYGDRLSDTARVWWLLRYVGVKEVLLLDGGWDVWTKLDLPKSRAEPRIESVTFKPDFQSEKLQTIDELKKDIKADKVQVLDTRSKDEHTGKEVRGKRGGHIPGSTHLEWKDLIAADGRFKSPEELKRIFRKKGLLPEGPIVCY